MENKKIVWQIYKHTLIKDCPSKGKSYIGLTKQSSQERWRSGGCGYYSQTFYLAIKKYGWDNFTHEILEDNIQTIEEAKYREQYWIAYFHTYVKDPQAWGYNRTPGGDISGMNNKTKVIKGEVSLWIYLDELNDYISNGWEQSINSKVQKQKQSERHKEYYKLHRQHIIDRVNKRQKEKADEIKQYKKAWREKNKPATKLWRKAVECIETGEIFESAQAAGRYLGKDGRLINQAIKRNQRAFGYHWRYVEYD